MTKRIDVEVWVLVDSDGNYVATHDVDQLVERYEDGIQPLGDAQGHRRVKVVVSVPLPEVMEVRAHVEDDEEANVSEAALVA